MYGLPEDFDGAFFVGRSLELVCFSENQVSLRFGGDISITIESSFSHQQDSSESSGQVVNVPVSESDLMQLLGQSVAEVSASRDGTLVLTFTNGHVFKCFDDSRQFESYHIKRGAIEIHV
jgi:hypothetical protein